jgi:hypothetical protein
MTIQLLIFQLLILKHRKYFHQLDESAKNSKDAFHQPQDKMKYDSFKRIKIPETVLKKYIKTFEELFTVSILLKSLSPLRIFYSFI